jgi:hypothetical protein
MEKSMAYNYYAVLIIFFSRNVVWKLNEMTLILTFFKIYIYYLTMYN